MKVAAFLFVASAALASAHSVLLPRSDNSDVSINPTTVKRGEVTKCTKPNQRIITTALSSCAEVSRKAAEAARKGHKLSKYFKSDSAETRKLVAGVFDAVAAECSSKKKIRNECGFAKDFCTKDSLANTSMDVKPRVISYCPRFIDALQTDGGCHGQDRATTVIHEMTHALKDTDDIEYEFDKVLKLSGDQARRNAASFEYYANEISNGDGCN